MLSKTELPDEKIIMFADINDAMHRYKFSKLSRSVKECLAIKAYNQLISSVENSGIKEARRSLRIGSDKETTDQDIPTLRKFEVYWLDLFHLVFAVVLRDYGEKKDEKSGEIVSFTQLFFSYWKMITKHKKTIGSLSDFGNSEEIKWRNGMVKSYLKYLKIKYDVKKYRLPNNYITRERFINEALKLGASETEAEEYAEFIFSGTHLYSIDSTVSDKEADEDDNSEKPESSNDLDDSEENKDYEKYDEAPADVTPEIEKISLQNRLRDRFDLRSFYDELLADPDIKPDEKIWIQYYFTMKIIETGNEVRDKYAKILEQNLADKIIKNEAKLTGKGWMTKILADYCGLQPDTVRKKIVAVSKLLIKKKSLYQVKD